MIEIDLNLLFEFINQLLADFENQSTLGMINLLLFKYWLWIIFVYIFLRYLIWPEYLIAKYGKWASKKPPAVILAIDVPKRNEQSVQAMENCLNHIQGAHGTFTKWAQYIEGEFQRSLSLELVSIEGNVQFLIRCPGDWRNLIEAAVYGQYPDAEITEVEDYVNTVPKEYPSDTHDIWGVEMTLSSKSDYLPVKPWFKFEHAFAKTFVDPMAALLENMSSIGEGEQIWIQFLLTPLAVDWGKGAQKEIDKIMGRPAPAPKPSLIGQALKGPVTMIGEFTEQLAGVEMSSSGDEKKEQERMQFLALSPAQREQIEAMERKAGNWAFNTKIRYLYVNEKGKGSKVIGVNGVIGSFKQWHDVNLAGLRPDLKATGTSSPQYILIKYRRKVAANRLMIAYRNRDTVIGTKARPMCTEELASLWHFPSMYVKAPLMKKTDFTKVAAPVGLPTKGIEAAPEPVAPLQEKLAAEEPVEEATSIEPSFDYDSDDFEKQFAKDKKAFEKSRPERAKVLTGVAEEDAKNLLELEKKLTNEEVTEKVETQQEDKADKLSNLPFID
jgi:hypothetical protein